MTQTVADIAAELGERWPGYAEQSWSERFAELDRRHTALQAKFFRIATINARLRHHLTTGDQHEAG